MRKLIFILIAVFLILVLFLTVVSFALAIADPDSDPQVRAVYVYNDLLEDGDVGILTDYFIDYVASGNPPTGELANEAFMAVFIDIDGITQLRAVSPYVFDDSGYGRGIIWIYFSAAEVSTLSIDQANEALYEVWLVGNPGLTWVPGPDPPKTVATLDYWQPAGSSAATLLGNRVLYYADILELAWTESLLQTTPLGPKLSTTGESYFTNAILNLRDISPHIFASGSQNPIIEDLDYTTTFGATIANDGGTLTAASPLTLVEGVNNVDVAALGTFTLTLARGTIGTATSDVCQVTNSPAPLVFGSNTITTTAPVGNIIVDVEVVGAEAEARSIVDGTAFDLTEPAARFGMSRWMFSGGIWLLITVIACAALYKGMSRTDGTMMQRGSGKLVFLVFCLCFIGGLYLGLLHPVVIALIFIACVAFIAYVVFFKGASA